MYKEDKNYSLMKNTLNLLKKDNRSLLDIHKESKIPFYWLRKFKASEFSDPSVNRVQALYEFLTGKKLPVD